MVCFNYSVIISVLKRKHYSNFLAIRLLNIIKIFPKVLRIFAFSLRSFAGWGKKGQREDYQLTGLHCQFTRRSFINLIKNTIAIIWNGIIGARYLSAVIKGTCMQMKYAGTLNSNTASFLFSEFNKTRKNKDSDPIKEINEIIILSQKALNT